MQHRDFSVLDQLPDPVIILDPQDRITFLNRQAVEFGMMFQESVAPGILFTEFVSAGRSDFAYAILQQLKNEKAPRIQEMQFRDAKGKGCNVEITYSPVVDEAGNTQLTVILIREISNERIFEKKASQLVHDFSNLIEHANAVIFGLDSQEYITDWNEECARITGLNRNDVLAQHVEEIIADEFKEGFRTYLANVFAKKTIRNFELQFKTNTETPVIVLLNATPRINNAGVMIGILFVGHDITELFRYRQSLEHMVREKTEKLTQAVEKEKELVGIKNRFVSLASHEFRIPLSNIMSSANFFREKGKADPAQLEKIKNIESQVGHMRTLIDDLLTIGKADAHKLQPAHQAFDLVEFMNKICEEVIINANHSHTIQVKVSDSALKIESDQKLLRNVFVNLLSNAIKFSPGKTQVFVSIRKNAGQAEISVTDQGIGIGEGDRVKVFEPFNRGINASEIKGTGLGLSIAKRAVETLGGSIALTSQLQKGTIFTVTLPCP
jgi:PAS domain S-box-containing protein